MPTSYRKKMIEVAIPLDAINKESAREKSIRHGHPSTLHLWWARRPLAACRAVLFTSLIDDPGEEGVPQALLDKIDALANPLDVLPADNETEVRRKKLFAFIAELVKWENTTNETVIGTARDLILAATDGNPPPVLDPFCGGGSIPLEAQRLGLQAYASDLNPVAVLITKALIEIPPKFAGRPPVNPDDRAKMGSGGVWRGAAGLAADVRYYGKWMRERAFERIGHLYPKGPNGETIVAWLWARTVTCPNPACRGTMPLVRSFWVSTKKGKEAWVEPVIDEGAKTVRFKVRTSGSRNDSAVSAGTKSARADFTCPMCGQVANGKHTKAEGMAGRLGSQLMAVVAEGKRRRTYLSPGQVAVPPLTEAEHARVNGAREGFLAGATPQRLTGGTCYGYGLTTWGSLFTPRQLVALTTFSDLVGEARALVRDHAVGAGMVADGVGIDAGGTSADAYADAVATYLAFALDKLSDRSTNLVTWFTERDSTRNTFARQALPMAWDFAELNTLLDGTGSFWNAVDWEAQVLETSPVADGVGSAAQLDASQSLDGTPSSSVATDPPYYDNIGYADLSDFFYVWLRRSLGRIYPNIFATLLTPKDQELVATPYRFNGSRSEADKHFENGMAKAWALVRQRAPLTVPLTVYYAFRQLEGDAGSTGPIASTGWEKMISGLISGGFEITGTWPMRTELGNRIIGRDANALASSVVLVCRPRSDASPIATLREFQAALKEELPRALHHMIGGHIAPVDLAQAAIGPGMGVFSRYSRVIEPNGDDMTVRRALELINTGIEEFFSEREGAFDAYTQFCARWFEQHRAIDGPYGQAETLAMAKGISVDAIARDGLLKSGAGKVRLFPLTHYVDHLESYDPTTDLHVTAWESCHYLIAALRKHGVKPQSEESRQPGAIYAGDMARRLGGMALQGVELSYRLYAICERNKWSEEALGYNSLADSWPDIQAAMGGPEQGQMV